MPVIREDRTYSIGAIGVARVASPVPSSNGSQAIAQAVSSAADNMADRFFREGAKKAEQFGTEQAASVSKETILAIDPATGAPKAYETPKGFGTIAQDAYQRVVLTRFQSSVEEEIRLKAKELAAVYDGSVERYSAAMSEYIGAMAVNADGQFQTYIQDVGTSYLNATRTAMAIDQINRERSAAAKAQEASIAAGNDTLRTIIARDGAGSILSGTPTPASTVNTSVGVAIKDVAEAELVDASQLAKMNSDQIFAVTAGHVEHLASLVKTSVEGNMLHAAITSGDPSLIEDPTLRVLMSTLDYEARAKIEKISEDYVSDRSDFLKLDEEKKIAEVRTSNAIAAVDYVQSSNLLLSSRKKQAMTMPLDAVVSASGLDYRDNLAEAARLEESGDTKGAIARREVAKNELNADAEGLFVRALVGSDIAKTNQISAAVREGNPSIAPTDKQLEVKAIIDLGNVNPDILKSFDTFAGKHRDDTAGTLEDQKQTNLFVETSKAIQSDRILMSQLSVEEIEQAFFKTEDSILGSSLKETSKVSLREQAANVAALASLSKVFRGTPPTIQQMQEMDVYIEDPSSPNTLSVDQKKALDLVVKLQGISKDKSSITEALEDYITKTENEYTRQENEAIKNQTLTDIGRGQANGSEPSVQVAGDEYLAKLHPTLVGNKTGISVGDILSEESLFSDPKYQGVLNDLSKMSVLPKSVVNVFKGLANNQIGADRIPSILKSYENLRYNTSSMTGEQIASPALLSALGGSIAKLDMMSGVFQTSGFSIEQVQKASRLYDTSQEPTFKAKFEKEFGPLDVLISEIDGIDGAMPEDIETLKYAALGLAASAEVSGMGRSGILDTLQRQSDLSFPNDGVVMGPNGGLKSKYALSITVGKNAPLFSKFALETVKKAGMTSDGQKISKARMADLNNIGSSATSTVTSGLGRFAAVQVQDPNIKKVFFKPNGPSSSGGYIYTMMEYRSYGDGNPVAVRKEVNINGAKFFIPLTVDSGDPEFLQMIKLEEKRLQAEGAASAERSKRLGQIATFSPIGPSLLMYQSMGSTPPSDSIPNAGTK